MNQKYQLDAKGYLYVIQQLKVKISRACINIRQYNERQLQCHQNKLFKTTQPRCTVNSMVIHNSINESPDLEETTKFWKDIWATPTDHKRNLDWLREVKSKLKDLGRQGETSISLEDVKHEIRRMTSWKALGSDGVHGF